MISLLEQQRDLESFPDDMLVQETQQPSGQYPLYLVATEIERRADLRKRFQQQSQMGEAVAPSIIEQRVAEMMPQQAPPQAPPQGQIPPPMGGGIPEMGPPPAQMTPQQARFMQGGIMGYQAGGLIQTNPHDPFRWAGTEGERRRQLLEMNRAYRGEGGMPRDPNRSPFGGALRRDFGEAFWNLMQPTGPEGQPVENPFGGPPPAGPPPEAVTQTQYQQQAPPQPPPGGMDLSDMARYAHTPPGPDTRAQMGGGAGTVAGAAWLENLLGDEALGGIISGLTEGMENIDTYEGKAEEIRTRMSELSDAEISSLEGMQELLSKPSAAEIAMKAAQQSPEQQARSRRNRGLALLGGVIGGAGQFGDIPEGLASISETLYGMGEGQRSEANALALEIAKSQDSRALAGMGLGSQMAQRRTAQAAAELEAITSQIQTASTGRSNIGNAASQFIFQMRQMVSAAASGGRSEDLMKSYNETLSTLLTEYVKAKEEGLMSVDMEAQTAGAIAALTEILSGVGAVDSMAGLREIMEEAISRGN